MPEYTVRPIQVEAMQFQGDGTSDVELADWLYEKNGTKCYVKLNLPSKAAFEEHHVFPPVRLVIKQPAEREATIPIDHWLVWNPSINLFVHFQDQEFRNKYTPIDPLEILKEELS